MGGGPIKHDVPHYSKWKVQDYPRFLAYQKQLEDAGLKDPWIRNHLWKHTCPYTENHGKNVLYRFARAGGMHAGLRWGIYTVVGYIAIDQVLRKMGVIKPASHGHH
ncbi:Ndufb3p [Mactra antiquata]